MFCVQWLEGGTARLSHYKSTTFLATLFCYLGDILSVDGDANAAVENRILITHTHTHTTVLRLCGNCPGQPG